MPPPEPSSALPGTPAYFRQPGGVVAMTSLVRRSTDAQVYAMLLRDRLHRSLRQEVGLSYTPGTSYDPRDGQYAHLIAYTDGLPKNHDRLLSAFLQEIELLADQLTKPTGIVEVVARVRAARRRASATSRAYGNARRELLGAEPQTDAYLESALDTVDTEMIQRPAGEVLDDGFLLTVEPTLWACGASLTAQLDAGVPADRVVPMPWRPAEKIPVAKTRRYERVRARFKR